ncbi:MAG: hypothetical protein IKL88_06360 [Erysipelotrichales bacterium]|nr:hypothetical protein [Erysipelotrichales bacterium]
MAFLEKINQLAKNIEEKTGDAIEITKLNGKIVNETAGFHEDIKKIGEFYYTRFLQGEELHVDIIEVARNAQKHSEEIELAKAEIEKIKTNVPANEPEVLVAPEINGPMVEEVVEAPPVVEEVIVEGPRVCPSCYKEVEANIKYCPNCGQKMEV